MTWLHAPNSLPVLSQQINYPPSFALFSSAEGIAVNRVIEAYSRQKPIDKTQVFKLEGLETCVLIFIWASGVLKNVSWYYC